MDNRRIDITSEGRRAFDLAMELAFEGKHRYRTAVAFLQTDKGLVLYWHMAEGTKPLPCAMDWRSAADLAWTWLATVPDEEREAYLDHDGSNGKGFRIYNESWGHVDGSPYAIIAIQAVWAWYGK